MKKYQSDNHQQKVRIGSSDTFSQKKKLAKKKRKKPSEEFIKSLYKAFDRFCKL